MIRNMNLLLSGEGTKGSWTWTWHDKNYISRSLVTIQRIEWRGHRTRYESSIVFQGKNKNKIVLKMVAMETESRMSQNSLLIRYAWPGGGGKTKNDPNNWGLSDQIINDVI